MAGTNDRPLVGISMRYDWRHEFFYLRQTYGEAVYGAGGLPIYIPLFPEDAFLDPLVDRLDGIVLAGSNSDVDPLRYGADPHPMLGDVLPRRDATDAMLIALAEERNIPLLAICYGLQALNVARGGTLIQDIGSQVDGAINEPKGVQKPHIPLWLGGGGEQVTLGSGSWSSDAPTVNVTIAPPGPVAGVTMVDGTVSAGGVVSVDTGPNGPVTELGACP
mgnify:CR=1 FL=1